MAAPQAPLSQGVDSGPGYGWPAAVTRVLAMAAALPLLNLLMIAVAVALTARWQKRRGQVQLASQKARWEGLAQSAAGFTVSESMTLGWLNVILRHVWPTILEKEVAEAVTKQIQVPPPPPPPPGRAAPRCISAATQQGKHGAWPCFSLNHSFRRFVGLSGGRAAGERARCRSPLRNCWRRGATKHR